MRRILYLASLFLLLSGVAYGQSTTVSGQVTDAGAQSWNGGTYQFTFVPNPNYPNFASYTWTGGALAPIIAGALNGTGGYSERIPSNSAISPQGSQWKVTFCPAATSPCYTTGGTIIAGATQTLNATPPAISVPALSINIVYATSEVNNAQLGSTIFLIGTGLQTCIAFSGGTCTNWSGGGGGGGPTVTYSVTDTTIVATGITTSATTNSLTCSAKNAIDNGVAAASTSHQNIVVGLTPSTQYSCSVTWGAYTSPPQNVYTATSPTRSLLTSGVAASAITVANSPTGDTYRSFKSNDGFTYMAQDDGYGFVNNSPNSGYNTQLAKITDETNVAGTLVSLANYGARATTNGTDGPATDAMTNKSTGIFGMLGNLYAFVYRQYPPTYSTNRYANWIKSTDHGVTWNNFTAPSTYTAGGNPVTPNSPSEPVQLYTNLVGLISPVLYAADDGTMGYNTAGNQIDGANAYVYMTYLQDNGTSLYLTRMARIYFDQQPTNTNFQYWKGTVSTATDFTNDSNWSNSSSDAVPVITGLLTGSWQAVAFVPAINTYVLSSWLSSPQDFVLYTGLTPAGPWTQFAYPPKHASGDYGFFPFHSSFITNTLTNNIPLRFMFNDGTLFHPWWETVTVSTTASATKTFVQGGGTNPSSPTATATFTYGSNVTSGNLLVCNWRHGAAAPTIGSITDSLSDTWNIVYDGSDGSSTNGGWGYAFAKSSGANTVTITWASGTTLGIMGCAEYHGVGGLRSESAVATTLSAPYTSPSIPSLSGDLIIGAFESSGGMTSVTASGYTVRATGTSSGITYTGLADNLSSSGGSTSITFTTSGGTPGASGSGIAAFF